MITLISLLAIYIVGIRFIGVPMAVVSYNMLSEDPQDKPWWWQIARALRFPVGALVHAPNCALTEKVAYLNAKCMYECIYVKENALLWPLLILGTLCCLPFCVLWFIFSWSIIKPISRFTDWCMGCEEASE